jgi:type I restriction enzyme S subunit
MTGEADEQQANTRLMPEDVLLNITGASIGRTSTIPLDIPPSNVNQHVCILRPRKDIILPGYLHLLLCSKLAKEHVQSLQAGTSREGLNFVQVANFLFPLPMKNEQEMILLHCSDINFYINKMINKVQSAIVRLTEYRTALITAAVTGKIDVRDVRIPDQEAMSCDG